MAMRMMAVSLDAALWSLLLRNVVQYPPNHMSFPLKHVNIYQTRQHYIPEDSHVNGIWVSMKYAKKKTICLKYSGWKGLVK
jgi:hypothetical protein